MYFAKSVIPEGFNIVARAKIENHEPLREIFRSSMLEDVWEVTFRLVVFVWNYWGRSSEKLMGPRGCFGSLFVIMERNRENWKNLYKKTKIWNYFLFWFHHLYNLEIITAYPILLWINKKYCSRWKWAVDFWRLVWKFCLSEEVDQPTYNRMNHMRKSYQSPFVQSSIAFTFMTSLLFFRTSKLN